LLRKAGPFIVAKAAPAPALHAAGAPLSVGVRRHLSRKGRDYWEPFSVWLVVHSGSERREQERAVGLVKKWCANAWSFAPELMVSRPAA
jgi:hypothetical protein